VFDAWVVTLEPVYAGAGAGVGAGTEAAEEVVAVGFTLVPEAVVYPVDVRVALDGIGPTKDDVGELEEETDGAAAAGVPR